MMLIAFSLAALACAAAPARIAAPPLHVTVWFADHVSPSLVRRMTDEADAVWGPSGITFVWERAERGRLANPLQIVVNDDRGLPASSTPLGWILFGNGGVPQHLIHVSYANAVALLEDSAGIVGSVHRMTVSERETYLGRAMGRALAHEVGHYLLASKTHSPRGLMRATLTAMQLFSPLRADLDTPKVATDLLVRRLTESELKTANP